MKKTLSVLIGLSIATIGLMAQSNTSRVNRALTIYSDIWRTLDINYVDTLNYDDLVETSIQQMLRKVDPYTVYIPAKRADDIRIMTEGRYGGIGAVIMKRNNKIYIEEPYEGMPAALNGLKAGDEILEVNGKSTKGMQVSDVSKILRGKADTEVSLLLLRDSTEKPFSRKFLRSEITISPIPCYDLLDTEIGYINFQDFTAHSAKLFADALGELVEKGAKRLIIDLRGNGGGLMDEAVKIVELFVEKGTEITFTKGKWESNNRSYKTTKEPLYPTMPLVVMVDENTASASEILAGSLQDLDRALLIGQRTYGKGLVQHIRPIAFDGQMKVTVAKYYIPSGRCIQAIDYNKRREDGSVERMPDSLTHEFKTKHGRTVRDGGGIEPDILLEDSQKVDIAYNLYYDHLFFDYATRYVRTHESVDVPSRFQLSNEDILDFENYLKERNYKYETESSKYCKQLLDMAKNEDIDTTLYQDIEQLREKLCPSYHEAIERNMNNIKWLLGSEIMVRYYYQQGKARYAVRFDEEIKRAIEECKLVGTIITKSNNKQTK